jgi:hypothetical protein
VDCRFVFLLSHILFFKVRDGGVMIAHQDFKNFTDSYWSYFKGRFAIAVHIRSDFGRNPMRASVEYDDEIKMRTRAEPALAILTSYDDNFHVALYKTSRDNMSRCGHKMTELKRSDYKSYVISRGVLAGRRCHEPLGTNADKVKKLGLGSNTSLREEEFLYAIVEDPNDPDWSTFACLDRHFQHFPAGYQGHIWVSRAPKKVLAKRRKKGDMTGESILTTLFL